MIFWIRQKDKERNQIINSHRFEDGEETDHKGNFGNEGNICLWWWLQKSTHLSKNTNCTPKRWTIQCVNYTSIQKRESDHWKVVVEGLPWWSTWLRHHTPNAGSLGSSLVRKLVPTCATKSSQGITNASHAATKDPTCPVEDPQCGN